MCSAEIFVEAGNNGSRALCKMTGQDERAAPAAAIAPNPPASQPDRWRLRTKSMNRVINRLKLVFLGLFAVLTTLVVVLYVVVMMPRDRCEAAGKWWDFEGKVCAQPVLISDVTGRTVWDKRAEAWVKSQAKAVPARPAAPAPAPATKP